MEQNTCEAAETKDRIRNKMRKLRRETSEKNAFTGSKSWQSRFFLWAAGSREAASIVI